MSHRKGSAPLEVVISQPRAYQFDTFRVDPETWSLFRDGHVVHLEPRVLRLLVYLIENRKRMVLREELISDVWGDMVISDSALSTAVARLRKALDDHAGAPRYIETMHSLGYRFIADVEEVTASIVPTDNRGLVHPRGFKGTWIAVVAITTAAIASLIMLWPKTPVPKSQLTGEIASLAVLPLTNLTGDPGKEYFGDGLQDLLITELAQIPGLRVISRQSSMRYRNSRLSTSDIAGELDVDAVVEGSLLREGSTIEMTVQLIDGRSDGHLWAQRYTREKPYVLSMIADMAIAIGVEIGSPKGSPGVDRSIRDGTGPVDARAIDAYVLGTTHLEKLTRGDIRTAIDQLKTAVEIEPNFARAWAQLAAAYAMDGLFGFTPPRDSIDLAYASALKAIGADRRFYGGHSVLGWARLWTGDFDRACESFQEALRLNPSAPAAIHGEADCLMLDGRMGESIARLRELLTISPFSAIDDVSLPYHLYVARRFDEAITAAMAMQARIPKFSMHWFLAMVYWQQGHYDKALEEERQKLERRGDKALLAALERGLDAAGPTGAMRAMAEALVVRASVSYVDPFDIGETFARAGLVDEALHWLGKAIEHGSYKMTYLAFWPHLDILRDDARYRELVDRIYGPKTQGILRIAGSRSRQE